MAGPGRNSVRRRWRRRRRITTASLLNVLSRNGKELCLNVIKRLPIKSVVRLSSTCKTLYRDDCIREHLSVENSWMGRRRRRTTVRLLNVLLGNGKELCLNVIRRLPIESVARLSSTCKTLYRDDCIREHLSVERIKKLHQSSTTTLGKLLESSSILCHILSFFSVKELLNFQLVSKRFKVPLTDPSFIGLHLLEAQKKPQLLISTPNPGTLSAPVHGFEGGAAMIKVSIPLKIWSNMMFNPLNGIFPFVNMSKYCSCFYNFSSRQLSPWSYTSLPYQEGSIIPFYGFGFDPKTLLHKLLCIWEISGTSSKCGIVAGEVQYMVEVLTVGENKWRMMGQIFPPYRPYRQPVYANGSIYMRIRSDMYFPPPDEEVIVAFDVGSEKFRLLKLPDLMVHSFKADCRQTNDLLQLDGHIAVLDRQGDRLLNIWISDDCCTKGERTPQWTNESVVLPFAWEKRAYLSLTPVPGTKNIIFKSPLDDNDKRSRGYLDLFVYDRQRKIFREMKIDSISPVMKYPYPCSMFICNESLVPVVSKTLDKPEA